MSTELPRVVAFPLVWRVCVVRPEWFGRRCRILVCGERQEPDRQSADRVRGRPAGRLPRHLPTTFACGDKACRTNLLAEDLRPVMASVMDVIFERISFGWAPRTT